MLKVVFITVVMADLVFAEWGSLLGIFYLRSHITNYFLKINNVVFLLVFCNFFLYISQIQKIKKK